MDRFPDRTRSDSTSPHGGGSRAVAGSRSPADTNVGVLRTASDEAAASTSGGSGHRVLPGSLPPVPRREFLGGVFSDMAEQAEPNHGFRTAREPRGSAGAERESEMAKGKEECSDCCRKCCGSLLSWCGCLRGSCVAFICVGLWCVRLSLPTTSSGQRGRLMFVSGWRCRRGAEKRVGKAGLAAVEGCGAAARGCRETKCCRRQVTWVLRWLHLRHKRESQKGIRDTKASEKEVLCLGG